MDVDSLLVMECVVTKGNLHDSKAAHGLMDSLRNFSCILVDSLLRYMITYSRALMQSPSQI